MQAPMRQLITHAFFCHALPSPVCSPPPPAARAAPKLVSVRALGSKTIQATASAAPGAFKLWRFTARPIQGGQTVSIVSTAPDALLSGLKPGTTVSCAGAGIPVAAAF